MHENEAEEETHFIEMVSNKKTRFETGKRQFGYDPLRLLCHVKVDEVTNRHFNTRVNENLFRDINSHIFKHLSASKGCRDKCNG